MPSPSAARSERLAAIRAEVRAIERVGTLAEVPALPFGLPEIDGRMADGGIAAGALHEAAGAEDHLADEAAATLFLAGIAARFDGTVLWALARRDLFAPALQQAGLPPERVLYAEARTDADVLAVMEEGLRHGSLGAVIGEVTRAGLTASRRLQLAAEEKGVPALLLRRRRRSQPEPFVEPSAAATRWTLAPAPSPPLAAGVPGLGRAHWHLRLVRQRGGDPFDLTVEANDGAGRLALPAVPRHRANRARRTAAAA
ncbi:ImuA family protein [Sphingomonas jatrophae]|uniref:Protein ImuA n=1 Tax=Sphingomonas jatrophae TaxID=1166337 RepID=A0A1I6MAH4_9SPHN|nr:hypothetical protein [Sphingomonas jatrophae]SFS12618.1 protein ImuA [Sphingomonas jatrophae]